MIPRQMAHLLAVFALSLTSCSVLGSGAQAKSEGAADCLETCRAVPRALIKQMLFDNNPTRRTIVGVATLNVMVDGQCVHSADYKRLVNNKFLFAAGPDNYPVGMGNILALYNAIDSAVFIPGVAAERSVPKRYEPLVSRGSCGDSRISATVPTEDAYLRKIVIHYSRNAFEHDVRALAPDGPRRIVRTSAPGCVHELDISADQRVYHMNTYLLLSQPKPKAIQERRAIICMYRSTLAVMGLPGALTYPEDQLVYHFEERYVGGNTPLMAWWNSYLPEAFRYFKPAGSTWSQVDHQISLDRGE